MTLNEKLFSFKGRLRRRDYWLFSIAITVLMFVLMIVLSLALGADASNDEDPRFQLAELIAVAIVIWPALAIAAKRLHDRNQSGWWYLMVFIPIIGSLWLLINLGILDGTKGRNKFGVSPKGYAEEEAEIFA